ncbi:MAG: hypothetical protein KDD00_08715 [Ignavibacteriae bacterium]|nr:hypothetical protein [Ignavibacteriota bacterium]
MSPQELKNEIQKAIDSAPDSVLNEILNYIQLINNTDSEKLKLSQNLNKILKEDKELLKRLSV